MRGNITEGLSETQEFYPCGRFSGRDWAGSFVAVRASDLLPLFLLELILGLLALLLYFRGLAATPASLATLAVLALPLAAVTLNYIAFGAALTGTITAMSLLSRKRSNEALGVRVQPRTALDSPA